MANEEMNRQQLLDELEQLRGQVAELKEADAGRRQAEEELKRSEASLNEAQRITHVGNWSLDLVSNVLQWSDEIYRIFEIDPERFGASYEAFLAAIHPDDREAVNTAYTDSVTSKTPYEITHRLLMKDGRIKYVHEQCETHYDTEGRPQSSLGTVQDITERRAWDRKLSAEKERLAVTLRSIGDGVIVTDADGNIISLNRLAETLTGWTDEEAAGRSLPEVFRIIDEKTRQPCDNPVEKVLEAGLVVGLASHTVLIAKDGTEWNIADSGAPIRDEDSKIRGVVLVFRDVTEKLRLEEEVRKAQKLESVGVLAGGIAHDFNNLLTAILGNVGLAKLAIDQGKVAIERLDKAEMAVTRAIDLTQQLLTFSRGGAPVKRTSSLVKLLQDSITFSLSGSNSACEIHVDESLWPVDADQGQMSQVFNNLLINASQAMPGGGSHRHARAERDGRSGASLSPADGSIRLRHRERQGRGHRVGPSGQHLRPVLHDQAERKRSGAGRLLFDCDAPRRPDRGGIRAWRRVDFPCLPSGFRSEAVG